MSVGKWVAAAGAVASFLLTGYSAVTESMPARRFQLG